MVLVKERQFLRSRVRRAAALAALNVIIGVNGTTAAAETLPNLNDEADAYTAQGLDWSVSDHELRFANSTNENLFMSGWQSNTDIHNDTEGDDLWMALAQYNRYNGIDQATADKWLARGAAMRDWMVANLRAQVANDQNADHLYGWGLAHWIMERGPDPDALAVLNAIRSDLEVNTNVFANEEPGVDRVFTQGNAGRRWARWLRFAVALANIDPSPSNIAFRDKVADLITLCPRWNDYPYPGSGEMPWHDPNKTNIKGGDYEGGDRSIILFHMGLLADSLWQARNAYIAEGDTTRATRADQRILEMADFWMTLGREPETGLHRESSGFNINTLAPVRDGGYGTGRGMDNGGIAGIYTISIVNNLVFAYKLTGTRSYLTEAWDIWKTWQIKVQAGQTGAVDHFADTIHQGGTPTMANNKGELQYVYALFENGGDPLLVEGASDSGPVTKPMPPVLVSDPADPVATVSLTASPSTIDSGQSTTLLWETTAVQNCEASGGWSGSKSTSGTETTSVLSSDTQFNLTCASAAGNVSDSVLVGVNELVSGDPSVPSWLANANDRTWIDLGSATGASSFADNDPIKFFPNWDLGQNLSGPDYHRALVDKWNGGAAREDYLVIGLAGGHFGSPQNTVYEFGPFSSETPDWHWYGTAPDKYEIPTHAGSPDPTISNWSNEQGKPYYSDGRPTSDHVYDHVCYIPDLGNGVGQVYFRPYVVTAFDAVGGRAFRDVASFKFNSESDYGGSYERQGTYPDFPGSLGPGGVTEYDPATRRVWSITTGSGSPPRVDSFDPTTKTWFQHALSVAGSFGNDTDGGSLDPDRRIMILHANGEGLLVVDLSAGREGESVFIRNYSGPLANDGNIGIEYEPVGRKFVGYDGGTSLYTLEPPANYRQSNGALNGSASWNWVAVANNAGGATPSEAPTNGTYGRFRYIKSIRAFAVINDINDAMYVYKIPQTGL